MSKSVNVAVIGTGQVGLVLLQQIIRGRAHHLKRYGVALKVTLLADTSGYLAASAKGFSDEDLAEVVAWKQAKKPLSEHKDGLQMAGLALKELVAKHAQSKPIVVDCSASDSTADALIKAVELGGGAITANKKPLTQSQKAFDTLVLAPQTRKRFRYESTVGAGTPIVAAIGRLMAANDSVRKIQGTFSGTLGYVMTGLGEGKKYSEVVKTAHKLGYTEPDPRDDLGGVDVARKALILARSLGWKLELKDVAVEPLYPAEFAKLSVPDFMAKLHELDGEYTFKSKRAGDEGKVLRYVATIENQKCSVGLQALPKDHPIGRLTGTQNMVAFYTATFGDNPLVVQGAGAGGEVTAAGILADILELADVLA